MTGAMQQPTGLVLAGGRGSRMGGVDKGLQPFDGVPLALHALRRLRLQLDDVAINANRHFDDYAAFGAPVWPDDVEGRPGPLAGFLSALVRCPTPWLLTVPCDTPRFPADLAERMTAALASSPDAEIVVAAAPEPDHDGVIALRAQPVFCLLSRSLHDSLADFVARGGRKIDAWTARHRTVTVAFDRPGDDPDAFANANTLAELAALEGRVRP